MVHVLAEDGKLLRVVKLTDYTAEKVRTFYPASELKEKWADLEERAEILSRLEERGIDFEELAQAAGRPQADPFDLLCHLAYGAPLLTRLERAEKLRKKERNFFDRYGPEARAVLEELLEKYADHGIGEFEIPEALTLPPISGYGNVKEISGFFGGPERLRAAVRELQTLLYAV
ncbi:type I restriction-modification enzyme R subunit C-terminal domain-containing protein [Methanotrichaceae archaeon Mx]|uniref:Type I restriction-modification enzyme R subunit C-terminal domain-containing protein n=1 Tax=Candidatus Methanocrinis natronophilus TaxID=3033396 RepID=A0ABT5X8L2_9EURY|nr:type I restriction-modification enzyme R subunit C-terminal domain-containing protein [Candidatus Methanocrinis natronophilus]